ncbi:MAG: PASTA domain-containing protein [Candidatus Eiseniibacteriota bacterium]|nr:MAG: PASTA domain-containing protein [Candidatus Eisenbacteria bacterium]
MKGKLKISPVWAAVLIALGAFVVGVLIFNFAIMPLLVAHGDETRVPDLRLSTVPQAERLLREQGLTLTETQLGFSPDVPKGCVVSQYPPPFAIVKRNRGVRISVSSGELGVSVPELKGQSLRHAEIVLGRAGLQLGRVCQAHSGDMPPDVIISTYPGPGALVEEGGSVDMLVSLGSAHVEFMMPRLVGADIGEVKKVLESAGLLVQVDSATLPPRGRVTRQHPAYGTKIRRGAVAYLTVGRAN